MKFSQWRIDTECFATTRHAVNMKTAKDLTEPPTRSQTHADNLKTSSSSSQTSKQHFFKLNLSVTLNTKGKIVYFVGFYYILY